MFWCEVPFCVTVFMSYDMNLTNRNRKPVQTQGQSRPRLPFLESVSLNLLATFLTARQKSRSIHFIHWGIFWPDKMRGTASGVIFILQIILTLEWQRPSFFLIHCSNGCCIAQSFRAHIQRVVGLNPMEWSWPFGVQAKPLTPIAPETQSDPFAIKASAKYINMTHFAFIWAVVFFIKLQL